MTVKIVNRETHRRIFFTSCLGMVLVLWACLGIYQEGFHWMRTDTSRHLLHLSSGVLGMAASLVGERTTRVFCLIFGLIYGLLALLYFWSGSPAAFLFDLNLADSILYLALSLCFFMISGMNPQRIVTIR